MAVTQDISASLKRNLKSGKQYNKLIPSVRCASTNLGEGDTFHTVEEMRDWIIKYAGQTQDLSALFYSHNLQVLTDNIYRFLYNHIQYTADGALQQISSPACTWHKRQEGVDCKSFSVFASSILTNLGINHAIRQVRQPNFNPENWTHVYVVVYKDQYQINYSENAPTYVIDATRHQNLEVNYLKKNDLMMLKHVGLNAPSNVLSVEKQNIIENFNKFCVFLVENNVPVATVNGIRSEVDKYTSQGIDPDFRIEENGISINGKSFTFTLIQDKEYEKGLGVVVTGAAALTAGKALMKMLPSDFFGSTFGAIFANGFDLSCWGSSYSESKAQEAATVDIPWFLNEYSGLSEALSANSDSKATEALNKFLNGIGGYLRDSENGQRSKFAKCTRKGYKLRADLTLEAKEKVLSTLKNSGFELIPTGTKDGYIKESIPSYNGSTFEWGRRSSRLYTYESYRLKSPAQTTVQPDFNTGNPNTGNPNPGNNYDSIDNNQVPISNTNQSSNQAGMGWLAPVAIAAIALPMVMKQMRPKAVASIKSEK